jgi:hypothetical protein
MGWLVGWNTRNSLIHDLTDRREHENDKSKCLRHCTRGNILWSVWEVTDKTTGEKKTFIACDKMRNYGRSGGDWGYKDMSESCHPYYYTCPISYLALANSGINEEWRKGVREHHAKVQERRKRQREMKHAFRS